MHYRYRSILSILISITLTTYPTPLISFYSRATQKTERNYTQFFWYLLVACAGSYGGYKLCAWLKQETINRQQQTIEEHNAHRETYENTLRQLNQQIIELVASNTQLRRDLKNTRAIIGKQVADSSLNIRPDYTQSNSRLYHSPFHTSHFTSNRYNTIDTDDTDSEIEESQNNTFLRYQSRNNLYQRLEQLRPPVGRVITNTENL